MPLPARVVDYSAMARKMLTKALPPDREVEISAAV